MKLKLNKKKMKTLSADSSNVPAEMTPQVAGGTQINSSYDTYRCPPPPIERPSAEGMTHCVANTCGAYTCGAIY